ncbi:hypothetical protein C2E23DRAFT_855730 [Lenzites betulinus]|nr:hypothetical protein C2E23DRAFT_855730 [Lenzites betulinus]
MRFSVASVLAMFAATAFAQDTLTMNTPASVTQCETTVVTWNGGVAPFNLSIVFDRTAEHFNGLTERTFSWNTDVPAELNKVVTSTFISTGTNPFFFVEDATSHTAQSALVLVQPSCNTNFLMTITESA